MVVRACVASVCLGVSCLSQVSQVSVQCTVCCMALLGVTVLFASAHVVGEGGGSLLFCRAFACVCMSLVELLIFSLSSRPRTQTVNESFAVRH